jgi:lipopolysaccharide export system permease protein
MTLLDRYIMRELSAAFAFGAIAFGSLLFANQFLYLARTAVDHDLPMSEMLPLVAYKIPALLSFVLPMAVLLGVILSFGRLSEGREIQAMQTGGIGLRRVAAPAIALAAAVSTTMFVVNEAVVPAAETRYREAWARFAAEPPNWGRQRDVLFRGRAADGSEVVVTAEMADAQEGELRNATVQQIVDHRLARVIEAEHARWGRDEWVFERGRMIVVHGGAVVASFQKMRLRLEQDPRQVAPPARTPAEMSIAEVRSEIARLEREGRPTRSLWVDLHGKFALPLAPLAFVALGLPLALVSRRTHRPGVSFGSTIAALLGYYLLLLGATVLGHGGHLPPIVAAWSPNLVAAGIGIWLLRRR